MADIDELINQLSNLTCRQQAKAVLEKSSFFAKVDEILNEISKFENQRVTRGMLRKILSDKKEEMQKMDVDENQEIFQDGSQMSIDCPQGGARRGKKRTPAKPRRKGQRGGNGNATASTSQPTTAGQAINQAIQHAMVQSEAAAAKLVNAAATATAPATNASASQTGGRKGKSTSGKAKTGGSAQTLGDLLKAFKGGGKVNMSVASRIANAATGGAPKKPKAKAPKKK